MPEALLKAFLLYSDTVNDTGISPYHILFSGDTTDEVITMQGYRVSDNAQPLLTRMRNRDIAASGIRN